MYFSDEFLHLDSTQIYKSEMYDMVGDCMMSYYKTVCKNRDADAENTECDTEMFDDYLSIVEVLRTAVHFVCEMMFVDKEIITGVEDSDL